MRLILPFAIPELPEKIGYPGNILLIGSCFTEHISERLSSAKFNVLSNPHGILFNPLSVTRSLKSYIEEKTYNDEEVFYLNELWNSWDHHTRFSDPDKTAALTKINLSQMQAGTFVREADYIIITLGSAFQYHLKDSGAPVANNHRAPAQWFEKRLLETELIITDLSETLASVLQLNPTARFIFTISPVRHIRDGVVDNNRSKARLIEAVHNVCQRFGQAYYFPAYELVIDVLRDYRFYDIDMVHPNYLATDFVWEEFIASCMTAKTRELLAQLQEIATARKHRTRFPETEAHKRFLENYSKKTRELQQEYPFLDLQDELSYFSS